MTTPKTTQLGASDGATYTQENLVGQSVSGSDLTNDSDRFRDTLAVASVERIDRTGNTPDGNIVLQKKATAGNEWKDEAVFPTTGDYNFKPVDAAEYRFVFAGPAVGGNSNGALYKCALGR